MCPKFEIKSKSLPWKKLTTKIDHVICHVNKALTPKAKINALSAANKNSIILRCTRYIRPQWIRMDIEETGMKYAF